MRHDRDRGRSADRPRIHDLRHSFAVNTLIGWHRNGEDVDARLPALSTYLGHRDPRSTYWYLSAAPELLALAARRIETTGWSSREPGRSDAAGLLHRPAPPATPGQPAHRRRLPGHAPAAPRLGPRHQAARIDSDWADLDAGTITAFLDHLEQERTTRPGPGTCGSTAIRSLFSYAALRHPEHAELIRRVLAIPPKRFDTAEITFLTHAEVAVLLAAPDPDRWEGRRDRALLALAIQAGLRVAELIGLELRRHHPRRRRQRPLPRQGPQAPRRPAHHATPSPCCAPGSTSEPAARRPAVPDPHRPPAQPRRRRTTRRASTPAPPRDCPSLADQERPPPRAAAYLRHGPAPRRRRHRRDRPLARSRRHPLHPAPTSTPT